MNILHINENIEIKGGVEVYLKSLITSSHNTNFSSFWIGITKKNSKYTIRSYNSKEVSIITPTRLNEYFKSFTKDNKIDIINIHNIFDIHLIKTLFKILPIVKSVHSPNNICPGRDKFLRFSEKTCNQCWGTICIKNSYTQGCAPRNPVNLLKALIYVDYEVKRASKLYKKIIVYSEYIKNECIKSGIKENMIEVIPYFTDVNKMVFEKVKTNKERKLFFAGRLVTSKGVHSLIEAVAPILKSKDNIVLDIVGDGIQKKLFEELTCNLGIEDKVVFHGWLDRDNTMSLMSDSEIVIFPSIYPEAFGIVGIEAMAFGKPVVAFNVGGVSTWLKNNITGFLIENNSVEEMTEKIEKILEDHTLYVKFSENGLKYHKNHFTEKIHMESLYLIYK